MSEEMERVESLLKEIVDQLSRIAYASEVDVQRAASTQRWQTCSRCSCSLLREGAGICPSCYEPVKT